ncbi:hypothetical protein C1Y41_18830 [Pantoea sp. ICBG 1758]|uniref:hypothetical protein n=1 Tax=Pantoea sp. ICBG 1758 TaxID=2071682 RepID=UPI000CE500AF|nr:hypothetical protein [Pantoea sp. ICBG 1758]PPC61286.1 hypothetical protein C1Y41_18830 [Pantoea sp. ICBG 1758]
MDAKAEFLDEVKKIWIETKSGKGIRKDSPEWNLLAEEYDKTIFDMKDRGVLFDQLVDEFIWDKLQSEVTWSRRHPHTEAYEQFRVQMLKLTDLRHNVEDEILYHKMRFSYAVTLMESCLSEMLKSVTLSNDVFKRNAMESIDELKDLKIKVNDLFDRDPLAIIDAAILDFLSKILYHNLPKVNLIYSIILGEKFPEMPGSLKQDVHRFMRLRHDIAHRNGKKINGEDNEITPHIMNVAIDNIGMYVSFTNGYIESVLTKQNV